MDARTEDLAVLSLLSLSSSAPTSATVDSNRASSSDSRAKTPSAAIPIATRPGQQHKRTKSRSRRLSDAREAVASAISMSVSPPSTAMPMSVGSGAKKANSKVSVEHVCETCSKVYRHPSCLIKHRWEHTPHWRESSKYVLSKHQQVQLLEAAAILTTLSPTSQSLPEDRSLWPSFMSGGASMPSPAMSVQQGGKGPRLHDYTLSGNVKLSSTGGKGMSPSPGIIGVSYGSSSTASSSEFDHATPPSSLPIGYGHYAGRVRVKQEESEDEDEDMEEEEGGEDAGRYGVRGGKEAKAEEWDGEMEMEMD